MKQSTNLYMAPSKPPKIDEDDFGIKRRMEKMTNREWLQSLSDEDFVKWCLGGGNGFFNYIKNEYEVDQPYPTLHIIRYTSTSSYDALLKWLGEERYDG